MFANLDRMTQETLGAVAEFSLDYREKEFIHCHEQYLKAKEACDASLDTPTTTGSHMPQMSLLQMHAIADYWHRRRDLVKQFLPSEFVESHGVSSIIYFS